MDSGIDYPGQLAPGTYQELCDLKARYFLFVDTKQWMHFRSLFTPDATYDGFPFGQQGPDHFTDGIRELLRDTVTVHQGFMPRFREIDGRRIRGRWSMQDYLTWEPGSRHFRGANAAELSGVVGYGYYEEEYRYVGERWLISHLRVIRLRLDMLYGDRPSVPGHELDAPNLSW